MSTDPADLSALQLRQLYRTKQLSPVETARAVLDRIARFDPEVNAFCLVDEELAMATARASEGRWHKGAPCGLLDGVPATIRARAQKRSHPRSPRSSRTLLRTQRSGAAGALSAGGTSDRRHRRRDRPALHRERGRG